MANYKAKEEKDVVKYFSDVNFPLWGEREATVYLLFSYPSSIMEYLRSLFGTLHQALVSGTLSSLRLGWKPEPLVYLKGVYWLPVLAVPIQCFFLFTLFSGFCFLLHYLPFWKWNSPRSRRAKKWKGDEEPKKPPWIWSGDNVFWVTRIWWGVMISLGVCLVALRCSDRWSRIISSAVRFTSPSPPAFFCRDVSPKEHLKVTEGPFTAEVGVGWEEVEQNPSVLHLSSNQVLSFQITPLSQEIQGTPETAVIGDQAVESFLRSSKFPNRCEGQEESEQKFSGDWNFWNVGDAILWGMEDSHSRKSTGVCFFFWLVGFHDPFPMDFTTT